MPVPRTTPAEGKHDRSSESIGPPAPPLPLVLAAFDVSVATTFPAQVLGTSSTMTSTFITGRIAPVIPAGDIPGEAKVGRDSALPLVLGFDWRPIRPLHFTLWVGVSVFRTITVFSGEGEILEEQEVAPAPLVGGTIAFGF